VVRRVGPLGVALLLAFIAPRLAAEARPASPEELFGPLFHSVQRAQVFPDQKTFVDAVPRGDPAEIRRQFEIERPATRAALVDFVARHFLVPEVAEVEVTARASLEEHLTALWTVLERPADQPGSGSSLLPLPQPYIVPGGRFREVYYWDSYFTMLGLKASGRADLIAAMVDNFAYLATRYGLIPNGNRSYYLSRSQPPFFAAMVELLAEANGQEVYRKYRDALRAEYAYWHDQTARTRHVVELTGGRRLQRYYDQRAAPRPESYLEDLRTAAAAPGRPATEVFRDLRSAAESGWDFSSRWMDDGQNLATTRTTQFLPVDLNCLLGQLEHTLAKAESVAGNEAEARRLYAAAERRAEAIRQLFWSDEASFFVDYDLERQAGSRALTLAGVVPLYFGIATTEQADAVARVIEQRFLQPGGVVTSLVETGEQWDWPNGWAPLQWMTIRGLQRYGHHALAVEIASRWMDLNEAVYHRTGRMMEKYNVVDTSLLAGGGEYETQDGFGWTNGVLLQLWQMYGDRPEGAARK
jgi:alpha,alpha-trehalase